MGIRYLYVEIWVFGIVQVCFQLLLTILDTKYTTSLLILGIFFRVYWYTTTLLTDPEPALSKLLLKINGAGDQETSFIYSKTKYL